MLEEIQEKYSKMRRSQVEMLWKEVDAFALNERRLPGQDTIFASMDEESLAEFMVYRSTFCHINTYRKYQASIHDFEKPLLDNLHDTDIEVTLHPFPFDRKRPFPGIFWTPKERSICWGYSRLYIQKAIAAKYAGVEQEAVRDTYIRLRRHFQSESKIPSRNFKNMNELNLHLFYLERLRARGTIGYLWEKDCLEQIGLCSKYPGMAASGWLAQRSDEFYKPE